jgi:hypothetical protein
MIHKCGAVCGMRIGRGNRSTLRKHASATSSTESYKLDVIIFEFYIRPLVSMFCTMKLDSRLSKQVLSPIRIKITFAWWLLVAISQNQI